MDMEKRGNRGQDREQGGPASSVVGQAPTHLAQASTGRSSIRGFSARVALVGGLERWPYNVAQRIGSRENMQIIVRDNNVDQALRALKKKLQREGVYREMKLRRHYEKPSEKRAREHAAAVSRARKADRKRAERDR